MKTNFILISILIIVLCLLIKNKKQNKIITFINKYHKILFLIIIIASLFLYLYKLDIVPIGLNVDEAGAAYDAYSLAHYGVDRFLYKNPVYFINYGSGQNALYTYILSILLRFFDYSLFLIRIPAVVFGILSLIFVYKILKENKDTSLAIITIFIMLITPFFIMKSRWALESYLFLPLLAISLYYFMRAVNTSKRKYFFFSGLLFGITLYTYAISYIVIFVFVVINFLYLLLNKKSSISNLITFSIPLFLLALPLIIMLLINSNIISHEIKTNLFSIPKLIYYRGSELSLKNIKYNLIDYHIYSVIFINDYCTWNSISIYGTLYNISILFTILGFVISLINVYKSLKRKEYNLDIPLLIIFLTMLLLSLCISYVNINKINCLYLPIVYYIGLGIKYVFKKSDIFGLIILGLYSFYFVNFTKYYFNEYPYYTKDIAHFVSDDFYDALTFAKEKSESKKIINIDNRNIIQPYIYILLEEKTNPYTFNKYLKMKKDVVLSYKKYNFVINEIDNRQIYITKDFLETNMKVKNFGMFNVYYLDTNI